MQFRKVNFYIGDGTAVGRRLRSDRLGDRADRFVPDLLAHAVTDQDCDRSALLLAKVLEVVVPQRTVVYEARPGQLPPSGGRRCLDLNFESLSSFATLGTSRYTSESALTSSGGSVSSNQIRAYLPSGFCPEANPKSPFNTNWGSRARRYASGSSTRSSVPFRKAWRSAETGHAPDFLNGSGNARSFREMTCRRSCRRTFYLGSPTLRPATAGL